MRGDHVRQAELEEGSSSTLDKVYRYALRLCGGDTDRAADLVEAADMTLVRHLRTHSVPGE